MTSRRETLAMLGLGSIATLGASRALAANALESGGALVAPTASPSVISPQQTPFRPVHTPNGWSLPSRVEQGVRIFHLVAEPVLHEFAPGSQARCWGYNGSTPGPTLEAVEGERVRIFVTNRLPEQTTVHWHGLLLPSGMDGVGGLSQPHIQPGETFVYEFDLRQHGTHMYHPHADELLQQAFGMMGLFIVHPRDGEKRPIDRDYGILLQNWALHPGTYRPDPFVMQAFDLWSFNGKVFPATAPLVAKTGERVRIRLGNLSMWNHPIHVHGVQFEVTGSDGGRWPESQWRRETTEIVGVGQTRDIEFTAVAGDWGFHCHMAHHTMNPMGHELTNPVGVDQSQVTERIRNHLPNYMPMGAGGMSEHQQHTDAGHMPGPANTLPMMAGKGPYGNLEMGGMFTVIKVRDSLGPDDFADPGWYQAPEQQIARRVSTDADFGNPVRRS